VNAIVVPRTLTALIRLALLGGVASFSSGAANDELAANRGVWIATGITSYEYRYEKVCDCHRDTPAETIVTVTNGVVVDVRYDRDDYLSEISVAADNYQWFRTIDNLFTLVETAAKTAATLRVVYEQTLGYPKYIYIDYDHAMVGEEVELQVISLRAIGE